MSLDMDLDLHTEIKLRAFRKRRSMKTYILDLILKDISNEDLSYDHKLINAEMQEIWVKNDKKYNGD